jgi:perosamine synthetase
MSGSTGLSKFKARKEPAKGVGLGCRRIGIGTLKISTRGKKYVNQVLNTNRLSYGPFTQKLEQLFAKKHDVPFAVMSSSGTAALQMALEALKELHHWPDGAEVIVPATTFIATSNAVLHAKLTPVFVDIDPVYYGMQPNLLSKKITRKTKAVIPVHLFGQPADMNPIMKLAAQHHLRVIEDSAETMLARYDGKSVGSIGDIGCFSTYVAHLLTTGVGGINTTRDPELAVILRSLINHGRDSIYISIDDDNDVNAEQFNLLIKKRFSFVRLGHSDRITELNSAIGLAQLEESLEASIEKRRKNAKQLTRMLHTLEDELQTPAIRPGSEHSFMIYPIVLKKGRKKTGLVEHLEHNGIETRDLMPLINQPVYQKLFKFNPRDYPVSQTLIESGFYVGCHNDLTKTDLAYMAEKIKSFFKS